MIIQGTTHPRRLKVGVWLLDSYNPEVGGGHGYYSELINSISHTVFNNAEICFLGNHNILQETIGDYRYHRIRWRRKRLNFFSRTVKFIGVRILQISGLAKYFLAFENQQERLLYKELSEICDIIYYPVPMCQFENFPFIYTLWDLGHLNGYTFPEVCGGGIFESRMAHIDTTLFKALMVFCESETGKNEAVQYLGLNKARIRVFPLIPSGVISEKIIPVKPDKVDHNTVFIHYPAQFWAHKNHYNLIMAFRSISIKHPDLKLILTGSDHGNWDYIEDTIVENNLEGKVINLGFVTSEELKWLFLNSRGLIMPTLLGPTNMPPLEALALGCPVAVSDLPGHREQYGNEAIYFDPLRIEEIEVAITTLINNTTDRREMKIPSAESNMKILDKYFEEVGLIRRTWR